MKLLLAFKDNWDCTEVCVAHFTFPPRSTFLCGAAREGQAGCDGITDSPCARFVILHSVTVAGILI